jgi:hypothetical protein
LTFLNFQEIFMNAKKLRKFQDRLFRIENKLTKLMLEIESHTQDEVSDGAQAGRLKQEANELHRRAADARVCLSADYSKYRVEVFD